MGDLSNMAHSTLSAWFSQRPTFALMGEYSAGKSTLLNLLLGRDVLPTKVTATNMPAIWLTYGPKPIAQVLQRDGVLREIEMQDVQSQGGEDHLLIRLTLPARILKRTDIIDTPGISDPRMALSAVRFLGPYLDFVVWCSAANQAWRQTEKAMWSSMPVELRSASILALTRADTMQSSKDLQKVVKRCQTEAKTLFSDFLPLATRMAVKSKDNAGNVVDVDSWYASHAPAFFDVLMAKINDAVLACSARADIDLPEPVVVPLHQHQPKVAAATPVDPKQAVIAPVPTPETETIAAPKVHSVEVANTVAAPTAAPVTASKPLKNWPDCVAHLKMMTRGVENTPLNQHDLDQISHVWDTILSEKDLSETHRAVLNRLMSMDGASGLPRKPVIVQMVRELEDFANTPWCKLDQTH